jgi:acetyltransferase-like isoleucine patch superfamily enzyme
MNWEWIFIKTNSLVSKLLSKSIGSKLMHVGKNFKVRNPAYVKGHSFITIGNNFDAGARFRLEAINEYRGQSFQPKIIIGDNVLINPDAHIAAINSVTIGNHVLLASKVFISDHQHGDLTHDNLRIAPADRILISKGPIFIENNVWIGENVVVLGNVTIGEGSVVGANSTVTKSIPPFSIAVGSPAKVIKSIHQSHDSK